MHVHFIAPARYVRASHDIIRHPRLKGTAKALLLWALSLPPGSRETILTIGGRMPEGRTAVSAARRQLIEEGFVHIRRHQDPATGTWATDVMVTSLPLTTAEEVAAAWADAATKHHTRASTQAEIPTDRNPAVGAPRPRDPGTSPKGKMTTGNTSLPSPRPPLPSDRPDGGGRPDGTSDQLAEAARLLCDLTSGHDHVRLGLPEALTLAPLARRWLARDGDTRRLRDALTRGWPDRIHAPAAFLRSRLERTMPPQVTPAPPPRPRHECTHCRAPIPDPGTCAHCAGLTRASESPEPDTVERNRRGAARARALLRPVGAFPSADRPNGIPCRLGPLQGSSVR